MSWNQRINACEKLNELADGMKKIHACTHKMCACMNFKTNECMHELQQKNDCMH